MKKTFKVVMLPTNKKAILGLNSIHNHLFFAKDMAEIPAQKYQNLYILSDEEIKEGDWCISDKEIFQCKTNEHKGIFKKIVATTDKEIYFQPLEMKTWSDSSPYQIPESFIKAYIKAYNEGKPITEVDLEMEEDKRRNPILKDGTDQRFNCSWNKNSPKIKTREDNTVIVHQSKMYSREEVERFILQSHIARNKMINPFDEIPKWIDENL